MAIQTNSNKKKLLSIIFVFIFTSTFAIAYAQSPLYTSNQNQYFLHGMASAGVGNLDQDWLANTLDPTPVFSQLVRINFVYFEADFLFYIYYALLMGIYLFSLFDIASSLFNLRDNATKMLLFLALLIFIHSAALRFSLSRVIGINWTYLLEDGVADQRILGPVFQPSTFGVLLVLSISLFLRDKPILAVLAATLAATVHPTYLLSAATLTFTYIVITYKEFRSFRSSIYIGLVAILSIFPILYYVYSSFEGTSPQTATQSREILVNFRIPHHTIVKQWFDTSAVVKILMLITALFLIRKTRLFLVLLIPTLTATILTIIQVASNNNLLALIFPWRLSIFLIPISTTIILAALIDKVFQATSLQSRGVTITINLISILLVYLVVMVGGIRFYLDLEREENSPEIALQSYISEHKSTGDTYLTPVKMQNFRLATGAPVYVDFKSIPYRDSDVIEWHWRVRLADSFYKNGDCSILENIAKEEGITHAILEEDHLGMFCPTVREIECAGSYCLTEIYKP